MRINDAKPPPAMPGRPHALRDGRQPRRGPRIDPLPSWNDGPAKRAIVEFVEKVTTEGGPDFVPARERIAAFDNDGTLWSEQPIYVQVTFALDRIRVLAEKHPEWKEKQPFKAASRVTSSRSSPARLATASNSSPPATRG